MNNHYYRSALLMMLAIFLTGCAEEPKFEYGSEYNPDDATELLGYGYKDAPDITKYEEYILERKQLEEKYMIKDFDQDSLKSEYEKTKSSYESSSKGPVEFARNSVPELNQTIDAIGDQIKLYDMRIRQLSQELLDLGYLPKGDEAIIEWKAEKQELESTSMDLFKKREDLYITFRKFELNPQSDKAEAEYQTMMQEAQYSIERIQQSFKNE